ncbi:MAG TPA: response regulator, partial [Polyangiales bacterium]
FEMFAKIERSVPDANGGLGIGLALSRQLAMLHGGALVAQSAGEGQGATFTLSLPLVDAAKTKLAPEPKDTARVDAPASLSVVLIEDNADAAELLEIWLTQMGHHVRVARDGLEGLALVGEVVPQVVLCDLGLPGMGGLEVCERVRALELPSQPVMVALTGWGMTEDRRRTQGVGFDHHLVKPVTAEALLEVLATVPVGVPRS